jgi:hypothetical protein
MEYVNKLPIVQLGEDSAVMVTQRASKNEQAIK